MEKISTLTDSTAFSTRRRDFSLRRTLFSLAKKELEREETLSAGRVTSTSRNCWN